MKLLPFLFVLAFSLSFSFEHEDEVIGDLNGLTIYGPGDNTVHSHTNGYRYGLKWQCVEFVKRYYKLHLDHEMPNVWGHAIDYYDPKIKDGEMNKARKLVQFKNGTSSPPAVNDLLVLDWAPPWGHVAIISEVGEDYVEIAQQNAGPAKYQLDLSKKDGCYLIGSNALGWLRLKAN